MLIHAHENPWDESFVTPFYRQADTSQRASRWAEPTSQPGCTAPAPEIRAPDVPGPPRAPRPPPYPQRIQLGSREPLRGPLRGRPSSKSSFSGPSEPGWSPSSHPPPPLAELGFGLADASWRGAPGRPGLGGGGGGGGSVRDSSPGESSSLAGSPCLSAVRPPREVPHLGPCAPRPSSRPAGRGRGAERSQWASEARTTPRGLRAAAAIHWLGLPGGGA